MWNSVKEREKVAEVKEFKYLGIYNPRWKGRRRNEGDARKYIVR